MPKKFFYTFIISLAFILTTFITPVFAFEPSSNTIYQGIDVSEWQGNIDFKKVKTAGIEVVYIRAGQGFTYKDAKFERNYTQAKKNNLKVGVYHYVTARNEEEAKMQARFFASLLSGKTIDCKLAMDFEYFPGLTKGEINKISLAFLKELEKVYGKDAIVYSNSYNASNTFDKEVAQYPLWIAQYGVKEPENNGRWKAWQGFQYTSTGKIKGIEGNVDKDQYTKDVLLDKAISIKPIEKPEYKGEDRIVYRIKKGDTLSGIAKKYNTNVAHLVEINDIRNPNLIYAGEKIIVSCNCNEGKKIERKIKIKPGDTLSKIAKKYNTSIKTLVRLNNIKNPNLIYSGDTLRVL